MLLILDIYVSRLFLCVCLKVGVKDHFILSFLSWVVCWHSPQACSALASCFRVLMLQTVFCYKQKQCTIWSQKTWVPVPIHLRGLWAWEGHLVSLSSSLKWIVILCDTTHQTGKMRKTKDHIKCWQGCGAARIVRRCGWQCQLVEPNLENWCHLPKLHIHLLYDPAGVIKL